MKNIPQTQCAVQLIGPDELKFNSEKSVHKPGKFQILCKVEVTGLCFSDLKLLKQFSSHVRKSEIVSGIDASVLKDIPSYVPGKKPAVPGHESVVRVVKIGPEVEGYKEGQRYLVQSDYRWLLTKSSNGAFGYNCEGGLQEYVLMDIRVITSPQGDSMLIPASEELSASAIALVEPWACVEDAYVSAERTTLKENGKMLVVADSDVDVENLKKLFAKFGTPAEITWIGANRPQLDIKTETCDDISTLQDALFDDVIYFGSAPKTAEKLFAKAASHGLVNIVLCGGKFDTVVATQVGRVHYGGIRIIGTTGTDPAEAMKTVPASDEIRKGDKINVIGAAGPMGVMHVIRNICQGVKDITVYAGDVDDNRLETLSKIARPLAEKNNVSYKPYNAKTDPVSEMFDYSAVMAPVPQLVAACIKDMNKGGLINIFAGIPADVTSDIDLDTYIEKQMYFIGTSGSTLDDMKAVLAKVESGQLDTNASVAAVCGLENATKGIRAVENRAVAGKILVYPECKGLELITLEELGEKYPMVAAKLDNGLWTMQAEEELLKAFS